MISFKTVSAICLVSILLFSCQDSNPSGPSDSGSWIVTDNTLTDPDSNTYTTVTIGNQVWTVENLRTTKYNDGTAIPGPTFTASKWSDLTTPAYCWYNDSTGAAYRQKWGALYNWYAVNTGKLAPAGWHVPTDAEWDTLKNYLLANGYNWDGTRGGNKIAKSMAAQTDWTNCCGEAGTIGKDPGKNNASGFSALPGGQRYPGSNFNIIGSNGYWWSATEYNERNARYRYLSCCYEYLGLTTYFKCCGVSVRLLRDSN